MNELSLVCLLTAAEDECSHSCLGHDVATNLSMLLYDTNLYGVTSFQLLNPVVLNAVSIPYFYT